MSMNAAVKSSGEESILSTEKPTKTTAPKDDQKKKKKKGEHTLSSSSASESGSESMYDDESRNGDDTIVMKSKKRSAVNRLKSSEESSANNETDEDYFENSNNSASSEDSDNRKLKKKPAATQQRKKTTTNKKSTKGSSKGASKSSSKYRSDESSSGGGNGSSEEANSGSSYDEEEDSEDSEDDDEEDSDEEDDDDDDSDYDYFKYRRRQSTRRRAKKKTKKKAAPARTTRVTGRGQAKANSNEKKAASTASLRTTTSKKINYCEETTEEDEYTEEEEDYQTTKSSKKESGEQGGNQMETDDANVETIERVLRTRSGKVGATGSKTAIYNVEEHGDPNVELPTSDVEPQYLIKWQNWSHIHNTWESRESLIAQRVKGMKKFENYLARSQAAQAVTNAQSPEDAEYLACQAELYDSLVDTHALCERIIASQGADYLCKWQGLPYSDCTWEDGELVRKRFPDLASEFEKRQQAQTYPPVSVKTQRVVRIRPRFVALKEKPAYLGADLSLELRDYQLDGLNWLANSWCKQNGIILADEMGLGKTIQAISFLSYVFNEHNLYGPFLIVVPLSTMQGWQRELQRWSPEINAVVYLGDGNSRSMIQQYEWHAENKKIKCNAILTTYEILLKDKAFFNNVSWAVLIVDEAHRLKNEDSLLYQSLIKFDTNHRLLITGTPLQNSLKELWSLLHFIMPEKFDSWEEFDHKYSSVLSDGLRFQDLHKELQPYLLRRVKKDVEKSLPAKVEQILRVEMTKNQKDLYKLILTKNFKELCKGPKGSYGSFLNIMMELKKCSNHVFLIRRDETDTLEQLIKGSGKLLLLDKLLRRLKETGHRVLIFSQMVRMLDLLAEYLQYRRFPFQRLDGSIKGEVRRQALDHFNSEQSEDFCFLLSTRAGGLGINLTTADTVIIYDSDWNPQNDLQAQARAHRIGQKNQVNIYRLVCKNSIEEDIVERAKQKMVLDHLVIQRMDTTGRTVLEKTNMVGGGSTMPFNKEDINSILKFGAEELFKEKESNEDEREEQQAYDIDEILKRAETREEASKLTPGEELLSQFKVANFSTMEDDPIVPNAQSSAFSGLQEMGEGTGSSVDRPWSEIIPESERKRLEIEEENEKLKILCVDTSRRNKKQQQPVAAAAAPKTSSKKSSKSKSGPRSASEDEEFASNDDSAMDEEEEEEDDSDSDSGYRKRSGRGKNPYDYSFKGLNAHEIRRFVRSYRKFPCPLVKIDVIAQDAHLEEKSQACLVEFAKKMYTACKSALGDFDAGKQPDEDLNDKRSGGANNNKPRGPTISFNGVVLYPQQILDAEQYFAPLAHFISQITSNTFSFKTKLKQTYWQCEWSDKDDMSLLRGIYEYGYGNWEWIKADVGLGLGRKILMVDESSMTTSEELEPETTTIAAAVASVKQEAKKNKAKSAKIMLKPQSKHLRTRIDYLIKVLQNQINTEQLGADWKKKQSSTASKKSSKKSSTLDDEANGIETNTKSNRKRHDNQNANANNESSLLNTTTSSKLKRKHHKKDLTENENSVNESVDSNEDSESTSNNNHSNESSRKKARTNSSTEDNSGHHHHPNNNNNHKLVEHDEASSDFDHHHATPAAKKPHVAKSAAKTNSTPGNNKQDNNNKKEKKIILSDKIFNECKSILRPVKNALKNIDPQGSMNEREHIQKIKNHILEIGDKINDHLTAYSDPEKIKEWRNYLWVFVAKFTSTWSWQRIKDLYKKFAMSRDDELALLSPGPNPLGLSRDPNSSYQSSYNQHSSQTPSSTNNSYRMGSSNAQFSSPGGYGASSSRPGPPNSADRRDHSSSYHNKYKKSQHHSEYGSNRKRDFADDRDSPSRSSSNAHYHHHHHSYSSSKSGSNYGYGSPQIPPPLGQYHHHSAAFIGAPGNSNNNSRPTANPHLNMFSGGNDHYHHFAAAASQHHSPGAPGTSNSLAHFSSYPSSGDRKQPNNSSQNRHQRNNTSYNQSDSR